MLNPAVVNLSTNVLALYGSSFFLTPFTAQSNVENRPPHTPKFPPNTGARAFIAVRAPIRRSPYGEFRKPFTPCHTAPPIAYIFEAFISLDSVSEMEEAAKLYDLELGLGIGVKEMGEAVNKIGS